MFEALTHVRGDHYTDANHLFDPVNSAHSLLLHGPALSGKMTHAIEAARRRSCLKEGSFQCSCSSCRDFSTYSMKHVVILSNRDHETRIRAAGRQFEKLKTRYLQMFLVKSIRVMLLSYHEALVEGQDSKRSSLFAQAGEVDLLLDAFLAQEPSEASLMFPEIEKALVPLFSDKKQSVTIDAIRSLHQWMFSTSADDSPRFAIIEGIDASPAGANNAILKILEEPSDNSYFFILVDRPMRLLPTILSRLQKHYILPLSESEKNEILTHYFYARDAEHLSIQEYLLRSAGTPLDDMKKGALSFSDSLISRRVLQSVTLNTLFAPVDSWQLLVYFLDTVIRELKGAHERGDLSIQQYGEYVNRIRTSSQRARVYNQNLRTYLESLYYSLAG